MRGLIGTILGGLAALWGARQLQANPSPAPRQPAPAPAEPRQPSPPPPIARVAPPQPGQPGYIEYLKREIGVLVKGRPLTRAQVERVAQEITRRYFPTVDWRMLTVMAWIESEFDPDAYRFESHLNDASWGLMQNLLGDNARWLYRDMGARAMGYPTADSLREPVVSMYFGAATVRWLQRQSSREEWIVRAYNGGPGWNRGKTSRNMTANHWRKYQTTKAKFYG